MSASSARNVQHAAPSLFGFGRKAVAHDLKNARHVVLQTRNIFEAINGKEVNDLMGAMESGCKGFKKRTDLDALAFEPIEDIGK